MEYQKFINILQQHQTPYIKAHPFPESCATHKIPESFVTLLPDIVNVLGKNIRRFFLNKNQVLVLFGLQPTSLPIHSKIPFRTNRIINQQKSTMHLCCSLSYLVTLKNKFRHIKTWDGAENMIVDFTTGIVMNGERYISILFKEKLKGVIYGNINEMKLVQAWRKFNEVIYEGSRNGVISFNNTHDMENKYEQLNSNY